MTPEIGSRVARYRIERVLGSGGMGDVFLATDETLGRRVAIKFLSGGADPQAHGRLLREARAAAGLDHPGICAIYEVATDPAAGDFIVMQYVEGQTLAARLTQGRLPVHESLRLVGHVAEAFVAAHRMGLVHRDIKPQNIIVTPGGMPKLLDFGLATYEADSVGAANELTSSRLSNHADVAGTPAYMAPEQIRSEPADPRSDLFSLGCVLHECLTGRKAFDAPTVAELFGQILHVDPPAPSTIVSGVDPALDAVCARMLHKLRSERFQSAEEVVGALRALSSSPTSSTSVQQVAMPRHGRARIVGAVVAAAAAVGALWYWADHRTLPLPQPTAAARQWYVRGVEAMRDGTFVVARSRFNEATRLFPSYVEAHSRLAEVNAALYDERGAAQELLRVSELVQDVTRLDADTRLRIEAARAQSLRSYDTAVDRYRRLAERTPDQAGGWLDLGRAEEAAGKPLDAADHYSKAVALDSQYAAAHLRLGVLRAQQATEEGAKAEALRSIDEALRLYRTSANAEGESEALLRKGIALGASATFDEAREILDRVVAMANDPSRLAQRVSASLEIARILTIRGQATEAESLARRAVADASQAGLQPLAANGLLTLGIAMFSIPGRFADADEQFVKAIELAAAQGATRVEMRARLQQASLRLQTGAYEQALDALKVPLQYFRDTHDTRLESIAHTIASRAHEGLEQYSDAAVESGAVLALAESSQDRGVMANALEGLSGLSERAGRIPEALEQRARRVALDKETKSLTVLPIDLALLARLLIVSGRAAEAESVVKEIETEIAAGTEAFRNRLPSTRTLRALAASTRRSFAAVDTFARPAAAPPDHAGAVKAGEWQRLARVLAEYAAAELGASRRPVDLIAAWPSDAVNAFERREESYWVAATLLLRGAPALALKTASVALESLGEGGSPEIGWRLAVVAADAARASGDAATAARMTARAKSDIQRIETTWNAAAATYFGRPDLVALRSKLR